jgi:hypothetical protein
MTKKKKREIPTCKKSGKQSLKSAFYTHLKGSHNHSLSEQELNRSIDSLLTLFELLTETDKNINFDNHIFVTSQMKNYRKT